MEGTEPVTIGAHATCTDGPAGTVIRVVVDPVVPAVTHIVVEPHQRHILSPARPYPPCECRPWRGQAPVHRCRVRGT